MHKSSMLRMQYFIETYLTDSSHRNILDVGSYDVNGCYRTLFDTSQFNYTGLDLSPGPNVDIVPKKVYSWTELPSNSYDVVISGQAFEHIEFFWVTMSEMTRILRPEGLMCVIAPRGFVLHRYPVDCYRFDTDGMLALARYCNLVPLHASTNLAPKNAPAEWYSELDADSMLIAKKTSGLEGIVDLATYEFVEPNIEELTTGFISEACQEYKVNKKQSEKKKSFLKKIFR